MVQDLPRQQGRSSEAGRVGSLYDDGHVLTWLYSPSQSPKGGLADRGRTAPKVTPSLLQHPLSLEHGHSTVNGLSIYCSKTETSFIQV